MLTRGAVAAHYGQSASNRKRSTYRNYRVSVCHIRMRNASANSREWAMCERAVC